MTSEKDCLFCGIVRGDVPADSVAEGERWVAFRDIQPQAPVHVLVVPRAHVGSVDALGEGDEALGGELLRACAAVADQEGVGAAYRVVTNHGRQAGQSVFHLHLHVLGGRDMGWPPG